MVDGTIASAAVRFFLSQITSARKTMLAWGLTLPCGAGSGPRRRSRRAASATVLNASNGRERRHEASRLQLVANGITRRHLMPALALDFTGRQGEFFQPHVRQIAGPSAHPAQSDGVEQRDGRLRRGRGPASRRSERDSRPVFSPIATPPARSAVARTSGNAQHGEFPAHSRSAREGASFRAQPTSHNEPLPKEVVMYMRVKS